MSSLKTFSAYLASPLLLAVLTGCSAKDQKDPRTLPDLVRIATIERSWDGSREYTGVVTARAWRAISDFEYPERSHSAS
jgi:hypothetical protein